MGWIPLDLFNPDVGAKRRSRRRSEAKIPTSKRSEDPDVEAKRRSRRRSEAKIPTSEQSEDPDASGHRGIGISFSCEKAMHVLYRLYK